MHLACPGFVCDDEAEGASESVRVRDSSVASTDESSCS